MNLFDIDEKYLSHPNYPYRKHIQNIADSFDDESHKSSAIFHDLGKLSKAFQDYINPENPIKQKTTHALLGAIFYLAKKKYRLDKISLSVFLSILKHHGNLEDVNTIAEDLNDREFLIDDYPDLLEKIDEITELIDFDEKIDLEKCCEFFDSHNNFVNEYSLGGDDSYYQIKEVFSRLIFTDKYEAIFKQRYKDILFDNPEKYIEQLEYHLSQKTNVLSSVRNSARREIIEKYHQNSDKYIFFIEAPTGIGKTFTALHLALEIAKQKKKNRLITALPMTSIIDQSYEEYSKIFDENILLKYHHLTRDKQRNTIANKEEIDEQEYLKQKDSFLTKSWADDNVIITTFNQILNLFYSNKNRDLIKFWTLRDSVIIMDEIQAIPRVLLRDFAKTISYMSNAFNIDFILMSATIPELKKFLTPNFTAELLDNRYYALEFNNRYKLLYNNTIDSKDSLVNEIQKYCINGKSVLVVLNTKKMALEIFNELKNAIDNIYLLSAYFIPKHRENKIKKISSKLKNGRKLVLISTQVVEAGVDFDFDCGFREFSPLHSIIQTAGRVNRENRHEVKESARLIIIPQISNYTPYHQNDLLKEEVENLISKGIRENQLLPVLKDYFKIAINRTQQEMLLYEKMENLEFQEVAKIFSDNYMKKMPFITQLFIEIKQGLYRTICESLESWYDIAKDKNLSLEKKMEAKIEIRDIYKQVSQYVINVPLDYVRDLDSFYMDSEMKVCEYDELKEYYSIATGFNLSSNLIPEKSSIIL